MSGHVDLAARIAAYTNTGGARLLATWTIDEAVAHLRSAPPAEGVQYFYVVDGDARLVGVLQARQLLLSAPEQRLADIMLQNVVSVAGTASVREACELFALHHLLALPVVDDDLRLLGTVDITLYTDQLIELDDAKKRSEMFQALGVLVDDQPQRSTVGAFAQRFPWLLCNLAGGLACALMAGRFRNDLARVVSLALFIPVVLNLAESVASQSVTLTVHLLDGSRVAKDALTSWLRRELLVGLLLGAACGAIVGVAALGWLSLPRLGGALFVGIAAGVGVSALVGATMPILLRSLRLDPKVAAGPIALACADVATLLAYLSAARWLLG